MQTKKEILVALGSNQTIKDGKLTIVANEWFQEIVKAYPELEAEYLSLEPNKLLITKAKTERLNSVHARLLGDLAIASDLFEVVAPLLLGKPSGFPIPFLIK